MATPPPPSFDEFEHYIDWTLWVLDNGLPDLPPALERGMSVPVARWPGRRWGAVLHLQWNWSEEEPEDAYVATEIQTAWRTHNGWQLADGSGGSNWLDAEEDPAHTFLRPEAPDDYVGLGGIHTCGGAEFSSGAMEGIVGRAARHLIVDSGGNAEAHPIDSPLGIALGAFDANEPATLIVTDADGLELGRRAYRPHF